MVTNEAYTTDDTTKA